MLLAAHARPSARRGRVERARRRASSGPAPAGFPGTLPGRYHDGVGPLPPAFRRRPEGARRERAACEPLHRKAAARQTNDVLTKPVRSHRCRRALAGVRIRLRSPRARDRRGPAAVPPGPHHRPRRRRPARRAEPHRRRSPAQPRTPDGRGRHRGARHRRQRVAHHLDERRDRRRSGEARHRVLPQGARARRLDDAQAPGPLERAHALRALRRHPRVVGDVPGGDGRRVSRLALRRAHAPPRNLGPHREALGSGRPQEVPSPRAPEPPGGPDLHRRGHRPRSDEPPLRRRGAHDQHALGDRQGPELLRDGPAPARGRTGRDRGGLLPGNRRRRARLRALRVRQEQQRGAPPEGLRGGVRRRHGARLGHVRAHRRDGRPARGPGLGRPTSSFSPTTGGTTTGPGTGTVRRAS